MSADDTNAHSSSPVPPRLSLRSLLGDSGAVMIASIAAIVAGLIRTKFAAVELGPDAVAIIAQLTQLYVLVLTVSIIGLGAGMRVVLARIRNRDHAEGLAKVLVVAATSVSIVLTIVVEIFAEPIARELLGSTDGTRWVRIAVLAVPLAVALQTSAAAVQARAEFRALAVASIVGGVLASVATVLLMLPGELELAIVSLPVSALCQLVPLFVFTPTGRRMFRAAWHVTRPELREVVSIGAITFTLSVVSSSTETLLRTRFVDVGGLDLVARLQPALVFSSQGFGLILGALSATVLVRVTEQLSAHPELDLTASFNAIARRLLVIVGVVAFATQALSGLAVVLLFSRDFLSSTSLIAGLACAELLRAFGWIFGSALLPLRFKARWAAMGLCVSLTLFVLAWTLLPEMGAGGYVTAYVVAWSVGCLAVVLALAGSRVRVEPLTVGVLVAFAGALGLGALLVTSDPGRLVYVVPGIAAVALLVAGLTVHGKRGGTFLSDLGALARGTGR